jgi:hypothetical protein
MSTQRRVEVGTDGVSTLSTRSGAPPSLSLSLVARKRKLFFSTLRRAPQLSMRLHLSPRLWHPFMNCRANVSSSRRVSSAELALSGDRKANTCSAS